MYKVLITLLTIFSAVLCNAGEITYTGRSAIIKNDVRMAQKKSLNNALTGGIKRYLQINAPDRKADITNDYFVFIDEYKVLQREVSNNNVITKVQITINDTILDEIAMFVTKQVNTAVFLLGGLPDYVNEGEARKLVAALLNETQFSTKDQISFEQEIVDRNNYIDIQNAFQSVTSQYMFNFRINVPSYKAGEGCTVQITTSYVSANKIYQRIPLLSNRKYIEAETPQECVLIALADITDDSISLVREKYIASPGQQRELFEYELAIEGDLDLKILNTLIDNIQTKKYIKSSALTEFFGSRAVYEIDTYFEPENLAKKIAVMEMPVNTSVEYNQDTVVIRFGK